MLAVSAALAAQPAGTGEKLVNENDCSSCHAPDRVLVGPSYAAIARKYAGQPSAVTKLSARIREGGSGNWGDVAMTPHPDLTDAQAKQMLGWILSVKSVPARGGQRRREDLHLQTQEWFDPPTGFPLVRGGQGSEGHEGHLQRLCAVQLVLLPVPWHGRDRRGAGAGSENVSQFRNEAADVYVGGYGWQESERDAELGGFPQRGRHDQSVPVCEGAKPRSGAFR